MATRGVRGRIAVLVVTLAAFGGGAGSADAQLLGGACGDRDLSRPFLPWLDPMQYALVGDGGFEAGARGWKLAGGAKVVSGNEPWKTSGHGSRSLPQSRSSQRGTGRFFSRRNAGLNSLLW